MGTKKAVGGRAQVIPQEGEWRAERERVAGHGYQMTQGCPAFSRAGPAGEEKAVPQKGESGIPGQNGAWWAGFSVATE